MSSSSIISTRKQRVFMAHTCSECGFPMLTVVQIEARAQKSYLILRGEAEAIANETAENAIKDEIRRIESCYNTKQSLIKKQKGSTMIGPDHFCVSSISGFDSYCPKCLNLEPWKSTASEKNMDELDKEHFPVVFTIANEAEKWAFDKVREMVAEIEKRRKDPLEVERAINKLKETLIEIDIGTHQMNSLPEEAEYERFKEELEVARKQKENLGVLNLKAKKIVNEKIQILELHVKNLKEVYEKKARPIARRVVTLGNESLTTQAIAFGYTDDILSKENGNAFSYFFSPNDVPDDIIEELENELERRMKEEPGQRSEETTVDAEPVYSEKAIYCRKCGFKLVPDSTFCSKCGTKVE